MGKSKSLLGIRKGSIVCIKDDGAHVTYRCDCGNVKMIKRKSFITYNNKGCGKCSHNYSFNVSEKYGTSVQRHIKGNINKNNTSGYKGVCYVKRTGKYAAYINIHKKQKILGFYNDIEDAIKARDDAFEEYYKPAILEYKNDISLER